MWEGEAALLVVKIVRTLHIGRMDDSLVKEMSKFQLSRSDDC